MEKVQGIKYTISFFDVSQMKSYISCIIELSADGCLSIKDYIPGSRKIRSKEAYHIEHEKFNQLCSSLRQCIEDANTVIQYIDDTDAELKIYHSFGRVETMPRGLGNDSHTVGSIFIEFVRNYCNKF